MMEFDKSNTEKKLQGAGTPDRREIKKELDELVREKIDRLAERLDGSVFESMFKAKSRELEEEKRRYYSQKENASRAFQTKRSETQDSSRRASRIDSENVRVYVASTAALRVPERRIVGEGFIHRTWRLVRTLIEKRRHMKDKYWYTDERRRSAYRDIVRDCWSPITDAWEDLLNTAWDFINKLAEDFWDILLMIADIFIAAYHYGGSFLYYVWDLLWDARYWVWTRRKNIFTGFSLLVAVGAASVILITFMTSYEYSYHGKILGVVRSKEEVYRTIEVLSDRLSKVTGSNVYMDVGRDIEFKKVVGLVKKIDSGDDILNTITYMRDLQVEGYAILLDGRQMVIMQSEKLAKDLLYEIQNDYAGAAPGVVYTDITYEQTVEVKPVECLLGSIWTKGEAKSYLVGGADLVESPSRITIRTTEKNTYTESVPYSRTYIDNASLYKGETRLKSNGSEGTDLIVATVERVNGVEVSRTVISTTSVIEPVNEIYYRGTKPIPAKLGTGTIMPPLTDYRLTSTFGPRWDGFHAAIDMAAPTGTKIYAADGGVVTFSGRRGTYGYLIIIDHGGLLETYYSHCSKLLVSEGDKVYQGQNIALVGRTGRTTGSHLHFEVRYNGEPQNPLDYF